MIKNILDYGFDDCGILVNVYYPIFILPKAFRDGDLHWKCIDTVTFESMLNYEYDNRLLFTFKSNETQYSAWFYDENTINCTLQKDINTIRVKDGEEKIYFKSDLPYDEIFSLLLL